MLNLSGVPDICAMEAAFNKETGRRQPRPSLCFCLYFIKSSGNHSENAGT